MSREKWNHSQACDACKAANIETKNCNHFRGGKTSRERKTGVLSQRLNNQAVRAEWCRETIGRRSKFPVITCNGKRNRFKDAPR